MKEPFKPYWESGIHHPLIYLAMALSKRVREEIKFLEAMERESAELRRQRNAELTEIIRKIQ